MRTFLTIAGLRLREAVAGRVLWLIPLHLLVAWPLAAAMPGPTTDARRAAADALALALAGALGVVAAAVLGATPLPIERDRPRGALTLASPATPTVRVAGTLAGTTGALLLLTAGLLASALLAVRLGVPGLVEPPHRLLRAAVIEGGAPVAGPDGTVWLTAAHPTVVVRFDRSAVPGEARAVVIEARPRLGDDGLPGAKRAWVRAGGADGEGALAQERTGIPAPFRVAVPAGTDRVEIGRVAGNFDLGLTPATVLLDVGPRTRAAGRGLHAAALAAGLVALLAATLALSTVVGGGVAAAGGIVLALLSLAAPSFTEAADRIEHADAVRRARVALEGGDAHAGHDHGADEPEPTSALAPVFAGLGRVLPDAGRWSLDEAVVRGRVPDPDDVRTALLHGLLLAGVFTVLAGAGARRRP